MKVDLALKLLQDRQPQGSLPTGPGLVLPQGVIQSGTGAISPGETAAGAARTPVAGQVERVAEHRTSVVRAGVHGERPAAGNQQGINQAAGRRSELDGGEKCQYMTLTV